MCSSCRTMLLY
ncbi:MAG: hypothetical protein DRI33_02615 [Caldiserica bacterium]|nr:MAG: hypothetical protein DRI33_02615 [Caldisericota bacterium]